MLEQAHQRNVRTFGGALGGHTTFHSFPSAIAFEWSPVEGGSTRRATSLPAFEINFSFHPVTHLAILSWRSLKVLTLFLAPTISNPRYFSNFVTTWASNMARISSLTPGLVLGLKNKAIFCQLIACPEACSYAASMFRRQVHSIGVAGQNNRLLSAKRR